ncbi:cyclin N-terminal domain-containing protein 1 [Pelobates fuscus]|uniref:cyclin N-terminal domain-containing protein 1 n=1 Tax=Pelobates fuscus TaxID=191477 RepID=UPI002FE443F9
MGRAGETRGHQRNPQARLSMPEIPRKAHRTYMRPSQGEMDALLDVMYHHKMNNAQFNIKLRVSIPSTSFGIIPSDILEDILIGMAKENNESLDNLSEYSGCFKNPKVIEIVFLLSEFWCQDSATKYQAVEILNRFMILHIKVLYESNVKSMKIQRASQTKKWSSIKDDLCDTFLLHLVSCIQIASKLHFHCHIINNNMVLQFLQSAGYKYRKSDLLKSELTVLRTLHFNVNLLSPFNYVDILLEVLGHNGCPLSLEQLRGMCLKVMDFVYLTRNSIYEILLKMSIDHPTPSSLQR